MANLGTAKLYHSLGYFFFYLADDKFDIFLIFSRKQDLTFHANCLKNSFWQFMQIISIGDNLFEMSNSVFWEK